MPQGSTLSATLEPGCLTEGGVPELGEKPLRASPRTQQVRGPLAPLPSIPWGSPRRAQCWGAPASWLPFLSPPARPPPCPPMSTNKSKQLVCIKCPRCERHEGVPKPHSPRYPPPLSPGLSAARPARSPGPLPAQPWVPPPVCLGPEAGRASHTMGQRCRPSAPSSGQGPRQTMARPLLPELSALRRPPYLEPRAAEVPPPGTPGSQSPKGSVQPHPRPHPQPCPASLVLSHHGDCISKWEGLESPHILPPPTRVPLRPTFRGSWRRQAPEAREAEGHTSPWGSLFSSPAHCQAGATAQMSPSWAQGQLGPLPLLLGSSGVPVPWELCMCTVVTPGPQPA